MVASIIVWDEVPMTPLKPSTDTLRDIMAKPDVAGDQVVVFGSDVRQVLPVIPN